MGPEQLYTNSVLSGLSNMSYEQFRGVTMSVAGKAGVSASLQPFTGVGARARTGTVNTPGFKYIPTTGSILVLNFGSVLQLTDEFYAASSLGTFNLQLQLEVENNHKEQWEANAYELIIIPMNSGVFVNERGTSSTFLSLLTKQDVLQALDQPAYTEFEVHRMVGGRSFGDNLRSGMQWLGRKFNDYGTPIKHGLQTGAKVLDALGYGKHRALSDRVN